MGRISTVTRLSPELRECIGRLRGQGRTLEEILEHLRRLDADISLSRSALGRYTKHMDTTAAEVDQSRRMAEALVREQSGKPVGTVARLNMQLMHTAMYRLLRQSLAGDEGGESSVTFTPQEAMHLFKALDHTSRASKTDAEYTARLREEARKEAEATMEKAVTHVAGTAETLDPKEILARIKAIYRGEA